ncbi:MAG: hypothetical protein GY882_03150, partial [Actinomycetia bacterium]|nr:hypothetical protein [Actinomycetes bacterium]
HIAAHVVAAHIAAHIAAGVTLLGGCRHRQHRNAQQGQQRDPQQLTTGTTPFWNSPESMSHWTPYSSLGGCT